MKHRGRIQAQGKKLEASETWSQNKPPTKKDGLNMLEKLKNKIPKSEVKIRETAFKKAERFIKRASLTNGVDAPVSITYRAEGYIKERVDIEIKKGKAFINTKTKKK